VISGRPSGSAPGAVPPVRGLFQQRLAGDAALLRLCQLRFAQVGLAAEVYAGKPEELEAVLAFAPAADHLPLVHLDRGVNVLEPRGQAAVVGFAERFAGRIGGLVAHDKAGMAARMDDLVDALAEVDRRLGALPHGPRLYLEYAAGLDLDWFVTVGHRLREVERVSQCIDVGHVGISQARRSFRRVHPDLDLATLHPRDPRLPELVGDVQSAVASGLPAVQAVTRALGEIGKPVHFHLHDGHPLVAGLPDHFGFLTRLPIPFDHMGRRSLSPLYGPAGLAAIVRTAVEACGADRVSLTLEIHQAEGRLPLGDAADLFRHWRDLTNAERTNYWLSVLAENATLLTSVLDAGWAS
jgi:hypothetical protein